MSSLLFIILITLAILGFYLENKVPTAYVIPKPKGVKIALQASLVDITPMLPDLTDVISVIDHTLPQVSSFIERYYKLLITTNVNITIEALGQVYMHPPTDMPEPEALQVKKELSVLDNLLNTHHQTISEKIKEGLAIEDRVKLSDPNYKSQLVEKINEFKKLESKYPFAKK
jgi:hypothetical protein